MKKMITILFNNWLKVLTVITFIFPVFPLILLSFYGLYLSVYYFMPVDENIRLSMLGWSFLGGLWYLGGSAGLLAIILSLLGRFSKTILFLYGYATVCYAIIVLAYSAALLGKATVSNVFFAVYLLMTLFVIVRNMLSLYEKVFHEKTNKAVSYE